MFLYLSNADKQQEGSMKNELLVRDILTQGLKILEQEGTEIQTKKLVSENEAI